MKRVLIVDDDDAMRMALMDSLESCGYEVAAAENGQEALEMFQRETFSVVISDMRMPRVGGMEVLRQIKRVSAQTPVILITAYGTVKTAVEAMKEGAAEFLMKPFSLDDLEFTVKNVLANQMHQESEPLRSDRSGPPTIKEIITESNRMLSLLTMLRNIAKSRSSVLIQGESGTGKELIARYIYLNSGRKHKPFVAVNCAAIPNNLLESEMFGYEKGAFTGAMQRKIGKFEMADGGTLLLDEISEMDSQLQAKLLRVLQEGEVDRVGGKQPVPVDVRVIATTNVDLKQAIEEKKFRQDLYFRLNVVPVTIPPLRDRKEDIPLLAGYFLKKYGAASEKTGLSLSPAALGQMGAYAWPGNVRELENVMERAVLICDGATIEPEHLGLDGMELPMTEPAIQETPATVPAASMENMTLREVEKALIIETLNKVRGNRTKASQILGISVRTMRNKLHEYNLEDI
ncbi:MAG: sigma-54 dependent transcriptional regulator [Pseudomonadota bacterium]|nr:sigma-54 dependent transcriptional regulator [Pseudomonadota bacterium]